MLYSFSVTPLKEDNFEKRCEDIINMKNTGVIYMPLFSMTLVPEGNPVWDKVGPMAKLYAKYRDELSKHGVDSAILVQASLGHAYEIEPNPFQKYENLTDGKEEFICCPEDERFVEHFADVLRTLAKEHPKAIMLDDDFRLQMRPGKGCVCPLHVKEFNRRTGLDWTKDQLREHILTSPENDPLTDVFRQTQTDSLVKTAKKWRAAIDEIDPTIQGINCTSGHLCDSVIYTNPIFAGKGNPTMVRVPNGIYAPHSIRGLSDLMRQAAICSSRLKKHGIQIILSETDTIPFNRYGKSARHLHSHYTASVLDGLKGAKHWLCRSSALEQASGKAYRKILAKHHDMYEKLAELSDGIRWVGANSAFIEQEKFTFKKPKATRYHDNDWVILNLERMGIPFYFSDTFSGATFFESDIISDMTDAQLKSLEGADLFMDAQSAKDLIARGYGDLLGVNVTEWDGSRVSGECFDDDGFVACTKQKDLKNITPVKDGVEVKSHNYVIKSGKAVKLSPAVTCYTRPDGKMSVVYCGSPTSRFHYTEGFAFLNETRKQQFVDLLKQANSLPVYCYGDDEICFRAGYLKDGSLLTAAFMLGTDPVDELTLYLDKKPESITHMQPDGSFLPVEFKCTGESLYTINVRVETLYPVILNIK